MARFLIVMMTEAEAAKAKVKVMGWVESDGAFHLTNPTVDPKTGKTKGGGVKFINAAVSIGEYGGRQGALFERKSAEAVKRETIGQAF